MTKKLTRELKTDELPPEANETLAEATTVARDRPQEAAQAAAGVEERPGVESAEERTGTGISLPPVGRNASGKG
jgi:hypothetical protein